MRVLFSSTYAPIWHKRNVKRGGLIILQTFEHIKKDHFSCHVSCLCIHVGEERVTEVERGGEEEEEGDSLLLHCLRSVPIHATGRTLLWKQYHTSVNAALPKSHLCSSFTRRETGRSGKMPRWRKWARPEWLTHTRTQLNPLPKH